MEAYSIITVRTIIVYLIIVIIFRIMGKREIGELGILDLVVFVMLAEMAVMSIDHYEASFIKALYPMLVLFIVQIVFAFISLKSRRFRKIVDGEPTIIINNGKINEREMKKQRYNYDDLLMQLREKDIRNIADVEYALLEPTGKLSVFKKETSGKSRGYTIPMILDGIIQEDNLALLHKTEQWLQEELQKKGYFNIEDISFCSYENGQFYIDLKDGKKSETKRQ
ncbi:DUF421 domain-containing protein [Caldibacillus lycopersici]|uniref:DUF421 domain-containing protein n=1 Tax=Perspicuibacillus lycopersici TaxID=1325689 RepID=A0AAE3LQY8_9BACI|nr:DUF421 domain-containing protein [Perspicuibacillus lycopersici]MCU9613989.1 DUF421 domain-containing protein [Perspicuibacillus lycopersici]